MPARSADGVQRAVSAPPLLVVVEWWGRGVFFFLCLSVLFLGIGGLELPLFGMGISAWSISRTTFFFWLIWKLLIWIYCGRERLAVEMKRIPPAPVVFFGGVTVSLLPSFHGAGDYRYLFFGFMHYLMVMDLFSERQRTRLLFLLLALAPGFLVIRGILHDPSMLKIDRMIRFGYPLDHANTAGYLFAMSLPLAIGVLTLGNAWLRNAGIVSLSSQAAGLILSYSRGAWIGSAAAVLFLGAATKRYKIVCLLILVLSLAFLLPSVRGRFLTLANPASDSAIHYRSRLMKDSFAVGLAHPVFGVGYGRGHLKAALREIYKGTAYEKSPIWHAHNAYIGLFADTGLIGLGAFLWLLSETMYQIWHRTIAEKESASRMAGFSILAALVAFAVTGLGDVPFYHHQTRIYFFTLLALAPLWSRHSFAPEAGR